jgi:guanylate kinase
LAVFVQPPSVDALIDRLRNRSTESEEKIEQRVAKAGLELTYADKFDVRLVNDNLDVAKAEAMKLVNDFLAE